MKMKTVLLPESFDLLYERVQQILKPEFDAQSSTYLGECWVYPKGGDRTRSSKKILCSTNFEGGKKAQSESYGDIVLTLPEYLVKESVPEYKPKKDVKLSEIFKTAANKKLWDGSKPSGENFSCFAVKAAADAVNYSGSFSPADEYVEVTGVPWGGAGFDDLPTVKEQQAARFMLLHFAALYFEDLEDVGETNAKF